MRLVHHYLLEATERFPDKPAVICDDRTLSYAHFLRNVQGLAAVLAARGCRRGDRVLILLRNKLDFLIACYAVMAARGVAVPLMEGMALTSIEQIAHHCAPGFMISSAPDLQPYAGLEATLRCPMIDGGAGAYPASDGAAEPDIDGRDGAMILYTSGTTGKRKGVLLSHRNLMQATLNINEFMGIDADIREFVGIPLTHSFGFGRSRCVLCAGGTLVVCNGIMNPAIVLKRTQEHACDALSTVPAGFAAMFLSHLEPLIRQIGPQIRFVEIGSAPMRRDHKLKVLELFPNARVCMHYGLTEASRSAFLEFHSERDRLDTVGRPSPHVSISIRDEDGRPLGRMEAGEIAIQGDHVMVQYWQDEALNQQQYTQDGWFKTGDYGFLDHDGYLHLLGRKDEMINMGGIKIAPLEVEEHLRELFPDYEMCVVGVPDPAGITGEIPVVCYVPGDDPPLALGDLTRLLSLRLDRYKMPRELYSFEMLPKTHNGKILRRELRQRVIEHRKRVQETIA
jgi:long-chain acyl-CoA synthetase